MVSVQDLVLKFVVLFEEDRVAARFGEHVLIFQREAVSLVDLLEVETASLVLGDGLVALASLLFSVTSTFISPL